jgi:hypothetical protein
LGWAEDLPDETLTTALQTHRIAFIQRLLSLSLSSSSTKWHTSLYVSAALVSQCVRRASKAHNNSMLVLDRRTPFGAPEWHTLVGGDGRRHSLIVDGTRYRATSFANVNVGFGDVDHPMVLLVSAAKKQIDIAALTVQINELRRTCLATLIRNTPFLQQPFCVDELPAVPPMEEVSDASNDSDDAKEEEEEEKDSFVDVYVGNATEPSVYQLKANKTQSKTLYFDFTKAAQRELVQLMQEQSSHCAHVLETAAAKRVLTLALVKEQQQDKFSVRIKSWGSRSHLVRVVLRQLATRHKSRAFSSDQLIWFGWTVVNGTVAVPVVFDNTTKSKTPKPTVLRLMFEKGQKKALGITVRPDIKLRVCHDEYPWRFELVNPTTAKSSGNVDSLATMRMRTSVTRFINDDNVPVCAHCVEPDPELIPLATCSECEAHVHAYCDAQCDKKKKKKKLLLLTTTPVWLPRSPRQGRRRKRRRFVAAAFVRFSPLLLLLRRRRRRRRVVWNCWKQRWRRTVPS